MNKGRSSRNARPYNNALREEHARHTRQKILETAMVLLKEGSPESLSVPKLSERSGISIATVYRHFPNRESLFEGVDRWLAETLERPPMPEDVEELVAMTPALFQYYERAFDLLRMADTTAPLRELREPGQRKRDESVAAMMRAATSGTDPARARAVGALARVLYGFEAYRIMRERFQVAPELASDVVAWAMRTLLAELEKGRNGSRSNTTDTTPRSAARERRKGR